MATVGHLFAGITDYFKAYTAKNYGDVVSNAANRIKSQPLTDSRLEKVEAFRTSLNQNANLSKEEINSLVRGRNARHAIGNFFEQAFGGIGAAGSIVGGTMGYATKEAAKLAFTKSGRQGVKDTLSSPVTNKGAGVGATGVGTAIGANNADTIADTIASVGHVASDVSPEAGMIAGAVAVGAAAKHVAPKIANSQAMRNTENAINGVVDTVANAPGIRQVNEYGDEVAREIASTTGITGPGSAMKEGARWAGRGVAEYGKTLGQDVVRGAKWFHENRNSRGMTVVTGVGAMALMPTAYQGGINEADYQHQMRSAASNMSMSPDGGGTFLRPNQIPQVEDMGATGDLVFALHSLRNGE
jgi:hypothetical protein